MLKLAVRPVPGGSRAGIGGKQFAEQRTGIWRQRIRFGAALLEWLLQIGRRLSRSGRGTGYHQQADHARKDPRHLGSLPTWGGKSGRNCADFNTCPSVTTSPPEVSADVPNIVNKPVPSVGSGRIIDAVVSRNRTITPWTPVLEG